MKKIVTLGLFFCGFLCGMQQEAREAAEERTSAVGRDALQDYYDEQQLRLERIYKQIVLQKAHAFADACHCSGICCGVLGIAQQTLGFDPRAACITALSAMCGSIVSDHVAASIDAPREPITLEVLCALKRQIKNRLRDIRTIMAAHHAAMRQAQSLLGLRHRAPGHPNDSE